MVHWICRLRRHADQWQLTLVSRRLISRLPMTAFQSLFVFKSYPWLSPGKTFVILWNFWVVTTFRTWFVTLGFSVKICGIKTWIVNVVLFPNTVFQDEDMSALDWTFSFSANQNHVDSFSNPTGLYNKSRSFKFRKGIPLRSTLALLSYYQGTAKNT